MNGLWDAMPAIAFFVIVVLVVKLILDYKTRSKLIEKGMLDENIKFLYADRPASQSLSALKWGMVLIGLGAAVVIGQIVPEDLAGEITIGGMLLLAGLGLLIYYLVASRVMKKSKQNNSNT